MNLEIIKKVDEGKYTIDNYNELYNAIKEISDKYKTLVISDNEVKEAKTIRASLNNASKKFNEYRIEVEKEYMQNFTEFKNDIKRLCDELNSASKNIDIQVKAFEDAEKLIKEDEITQLWLGKNLPDVNLKLVFNVNWLNKSVSLDAINKEMDDIKRRISDEILILSEFSTNNEELSILKAKYFQTLNLNSTLTQYKYEKAYINNNKHSEDKTDDIPVEYNVVVSFHGTLYQLNLLFDCFPLNVKYEVLSDER